MTDTIGLSDGMAKSRRLLGALALLLHTTRPDGEDRLVAADLMLSRLAVEDFESWARFQEPLLRQFEKALDSSVIDSNRLLVRWMESVREKGLGLLPPIFLRHLRNGLDSGLDERSQPFASAALALLEAADQTFPVHLQGFSLDYSDVILLMKRFHESGRSLAAKQLAELGLRSDKGKSMWNYNWYAQILQALGQHDAAFDAQYQFVDMALVGAAPMHLKNGVMKALNLIPFCRQRKMRLAQLRHLTVGNGEFEEEFRRYDRLIEDIEAFRAKLNGNAAVCVGRNYHRTGDLPSIEEDLQREMRVNPSPAVCYELAKVVALRGDVALARGHLKTVSGLDALFFGGTGIRE